MKLRQELNKIDEALSDIEEANINASPTTPADAIATLKLIAPVLILVLGVIKIFTGEKADRKIDKTIQFLQIISL